MARLGCSYAKRVREVNAIYDDKVKTGLSNREIWRRYVYPRYGITEKTFYNYLSASSDTMLAEKIEKSQTHLQFTLFP